MISGLLEKISAALQSSSSKFFDKPLLTEKDLLSLQQLASVQSMDSLETVKEQSQPLIGDVLSIHYGQGLEFEENRPYTPGDDPRFLNWRLLARTGQLYSKVFRESRKPQVFIIVDKRSNMCFGTRKQTKLTQVAKLASFIVYRALQVHFTVGGVILDKDLHWFQPGQSIRQLQSLIQHIVHGVGPHAGSQQPDMANVLQQVQLQLDAGNIVVMISDFHDLDKTCESMLFGLTRLHQMIAYQVLDPIELALPGHGRYSILDDSRGEVLDVDFHDHELRERYRLEVEKSQKELRERLMYTGCMYDSLLTTDNIQKVLQRGQDGRRKTH